MASVRSSLITLFASRFGDVALFVVVGFSMFYWNSNMYLSIMFLLIVFTKRACFPFTSWLLEAMRAPTPVSCLVHSSTLVAAGVWFSLRYSHCFSDTACSVLCAFSFYSIILTGVSSLFMVDLKKLVALSTCNNICWCVVCFCLGDYGSSILFLFTHGVSKCLLFILIGDVMSSSSSSQRGFGVYSSRYTGPWTPLLSFVLLSCLRGLPFMGIFLTKHTIFGDISSGYSLGLHALCGLCIGLSFAYTYRFGFLLLNRLGGLGSGVSLEYYLYCFVCFLPCLLNYYFSFFFFDTLGVRSFYNIFDLFFLLHFLGLFVGLLAYLLLWYFFKRSIWSFGLFGCDLLVGMFFGFCNRVRELFYFFCLRWEVKFLGRLFRLSSHSHIRSYLFRFGGLVLSLILFIFLFLTVLI